MMYCLLYISCISFIYTLIRARFFSFSNFCILLLGNTGLMKAAEFGYYEIAEALVKKGADVNVHNKDGCCPLVRSSNYGHYDVVLLLLDNGADINIKSLGGGNTALIKAAEKGSLNAKTSHSYFLICRNFVVKKWLLTPSSLVVESNYFFKT